ncbi:MAG: hypothetical protein BA864_08750 [Desulfuromonadales bacterium C00003093]|nr:MAG: hypothetical protein BA864_08750 [Desulfuromonadales bacterium C00003093]
MHNIYKYLLLLTCCVFLPLQSAADDRGTAEIIALEIRNLSTSVDRLTQFLYEQGGKKDRDSVLRKLDIAVAYLNFRSRRIEMMERDLQRTESSKTRLEDIIRQLEERLEQLEDEDSNTGPQGKLSKEDAQQQLKLLRQRLARTENEIIEGNNRILELRHQLDDVENFVERHLEL